MLHDGQLRGQSLLHASQLGGACAEASGPEQCVDQAGEEREHGEAEEGGDTDAQGDPCAHPVLVDYPRGHRGASLVPHPRPISGCHGSAGVVAVGHRPA